MTDHPIGTPRVEHLQSSSDRAQKIAAQRTAARGLADVVSADVAFQEWAEQGLSPIAIRKTFETIESRMATRKRSGAARDETETSETHHSAEGEEPVTEVGMMEGLAQQFHDSNPEMSQRGLLALLARIRPEDSSEEILRKVRESYPDATLADDALEFLSRAYKGKKDLLEKVSVARKALQEASGREIRAGRNISQEAKSFSEQGLGSTTALRDLYRDITGNPRDANTLFEEFSKAFPYDKMEKVILFTLQSLGSDLKSKGPSISPAELQRLLTECRQLQAILWVYRFFLARFASLKASFTRNNIPLPLLLNFESLAKTFMKFVQERYPSADKAIQLLRLLGVSDELIAKILVAAQMRDACRGVAPRLFRSEQHRQDTLGALLDLLSQLEDELEKEEEEEEEEEGEKDDEEDE